MDISVIVEDDKKGKPQSWTCLVEGIGSKFNWHGTFDIRAWGSTEKEARDNAAEALSEISDQMRVTSTEA